MNFLNTDTYRRFASGEELSVNELNALRNEFLSALGDYEKNSHCLWHEIEKRAAVKLMGMMYHHLSHMYMEFEFREKLYRKGERTANKNLRKTTKNL